MPAPLPPRFVGIDVSKAHLDIALLPDDTTVRLPNDARGWATLCARLAGTLPPTIVLEATGSYHIGVMLALADAGMAPAVINPQRTHAFIVSEGKRSKTDHTDARLLARFGQQKQPAPSPVPTETARQLKDLVACRDDFTKGLVMEKNRLTVASMHVRDFHHATIDFLTKQIAQVNQRIATLIAADDVLRGQDQRLQTVPGVGPVLSAVLLARLGELGERDPKSLAALAGVAPHAQDSGTKRGYRATTGGRPEVCKALYQMAQTAVRCNPVMKAHFTQLRQRMPYKVAIIACARRMLGILNAMLREGITWHETKVGQGQFVPDPA